MMTLRSCQEQITDEIVAYRCCAQIEVPGIEMQLTVWLVLLEIFINITNLCRAVWTVWNPNEKNQRGNQAPMSPMLMIISLRGTISPRKNRLFAIDFSATFLPSKRRLIEYFSCHLGLPAEDSCIPVWVGQFQWQFVGEGWQPAPFSVDNLRRELQTTHKQSPIWIWQTACIDRATLVEDSLLWKWRQNVGTGKESVPARAGINKTI